MGEPQGKGQLVLWRAVCFSSGRQVSLGALSRTSMAGSGFWQGFPCLWNAIGCSTEAASWKGDSGPAQVGTFSPFVSAAEEPG